MLSQFSGIDVEKHMEYFDKISDEFAQVPMYFLRFFGATDVDEVLDAMDYAVYVHDVQHIILDNLQFMIGVKDSKGFER
jgi:twinkle protein